MTDRAPYLRTAEPAYRMCLDCLLMLAVLTLMSYVFYGWRPVLLMLSSTVAALVCEAIACFLMHRYPFRGDFSAAVTGAVIGAWVSPLSPYWLPAVAAAFAILIVKMPFGGTGRNLFNPAAAGIALATVLFPSALLTFPASSLEMQPLPLQDISQVVSAASPSAHWMIGGHPNVTWTEILMGDFAGPLGTTAVAVIAACAIYLFVRRAASMAVCLSFLAATFIGSVILWTSAEEALMMLFATPVFFVSVFVLTDPVTSPKNTAGRIFYGIVAGVFLLLFRSFARYEETVCFAVLLANAFSPTLDRLGYLCGARIGAWIRREGSV